MNIYDHCSQKDALAFYPPEYQARAWKNVWASALVVFLCALLLSGGHLYSPDEEILFRLTESIATQGAFSIDPLPAGFGTRSGQNGLQYPQYPPLQSILAVPLYGLARLTRPLASDAAILSCVWPTTQYHDQSPDAYWNRFWVVILFGPIVLGLTTLVIGRMGFRLSGGDPVAAWAPALIYGLSTLALPHSRTFFTEPLATLWALIALASLLAWHDEVRLEVEKEIDSAKTFASPKLRWALIAGIASAMGVWSRVDFPLFLPGLALGVIGLTQPAFYHIPRSWVLRKERPPISKTAWKPLLTFFTPLACACGGWIFYNAWRFGSVGATGYEDQPEGVRFATPFLIGLHGFLCSPGKGLFFFSPPILLAIFGIWKILRSRPIWGWAWAVSLGIFGVAMCKWQNWAGGWCWGPRHIFQIHAFLILGLAPLLRAPRASLLRVTTITVAIVGFAIQVFGSSQSFIDFYHDYYRTPRDQPTFYSLYTPDEDALFRQSYTWIARAPAGDVSIPAYLIPAPIQDSIYVPQHTQWYAYPEMARRGAHDWFWLHVGQNALSQRAPD